MFHNKMMTQKEEIYLQHVSTYIEKQNHAPRMT